MTRASTWDGNGLSPEITQKLAGLGAPLAEFRVRNRRLAWQLALAVLLLLFGAAFLVALVVAALSGKPVQVHLSAALCAISSNMKSRFFAGFQGLAAFWAGLPNPPKGPLLLGPLIFSAVFGVRV